MGASVVFIKTGLNQDFFKCRFFSKSLTIVLSSQDTLLYNVTILCTRLFRMITFNDYMKKYYEKPWIFKKLNEMMPCLHLLPISTIQQAICRPTWLFTVGPLLFVDNFQKFQIIKFIWLLVLQVTVGPYQLHDAFIPQAVAELGVIKTASFFDWNWMNKVIHKG